MYRAALRDGEFGPEASIGMYYCSKRHQQFTEVAIDVLGLDALLGTVWGTRIACDIDAQLFSPAR